MSSKNNVNALNLKIQSLAKDILESKVSPIKGCKQMFYLLCKKGIDSKKEFLIFTVVSSETDALPIESERQFWNKQQLEPKDKEIENIEKFYKKHIFAACKKLIEFLKIKDDGL